MGTPSAFARSVRVPGVSRLLVGRAKFEVRSASTNFLELAGNWKKNAVSVNTSTFPRGRRRSGESLDKNQASLENGAGVARRSYLPQVRFLTPAGEKKRESRGGGGGSNKGSMKQKRIPATNRSDGLGLLADEVEDAGAFESEPYLDKCGSIHLILGPMFAGKSTALLKRAQEESSAGRRVALVKSDKDSRYGLSAVVTHDGLQMPCYAVPDLASFKSHVGDKLYREFDVIGIDEAQFFTDLYEFCLSAADFEGKTVIAAGLDGDFLRRRFGSTVDLVRVADSVVKLSSRCEICGRPAIFSFRKTLDIQTEIIGGAELYMPVCRQHYVGGQMVVDSAFTVLEAHQVAHSRKDV